MKKSILITILAMLLLRLPADANDTISFATVDGQAYAGSLLPEYGMASAIISAACKRVGLNPDFHFLPWKRAMTAVALGKFDVLYCAYYSEDRAKTYGVSKPYMRGQLVLCTKKDRSVMWNGTLRSLQPYKIGVVMGYAHTPEFDQADFLTKETAPNELLNFNKLLHDRVDAIATEKYQAIYILKHNISFPETVASVQFLSPPLGHVDFYAMFSKATPLWRKHLALFNKGLDMIEADGTKAAIMLKFGYLNFDFENEKKPDDTRALPIVAP